MAHKNNDSRHIIITGFSGDNKDTPPKKIKTNQRKLKKVVKNVSPSKDDFNDLKPK